MTVTPEQQIEAFVRKDLALGSDQRTISRTDNLLELGIVDSLGILKLSTFLEQAFDVQIADEDLVPENFETLNNITDFVNRKL